MKYIDIVKRQKRRQPSMLERIRENFQNTNLFAKSNFKIVLSVIGVAVLVVQLVFPIVALAAPPSDFPLGDFPGSGYTSLGPDADEGGCKEHRNVLESYYQILNNQSGSDQFLFLRLRNENPAGWPSTGSNGDARYKWFFDTVGNDGALSGGNIINYEYFLLLEDPPNSANDGFGEIRFYNSGGNVIGGPMTGSGSSAPSGPQTAYHNNFGYKINGNFVDMYIRISAIGSPTAFNVFWSTDQENPNLDQAPNCDRPDSGGFIAFFNLTVTGTGTGNGTVTGPGISCSVNAGVATGDCSQAYSNGAQVSLTGTAQAGSTFDGWSGNCSGAGTCNLTMTNNKNVTAAFNLIPVPTGTIVIVKDTVPNVEQDFLFTTTGGLTPGTFSLDDDADGTLSNTRTYSNVPVGSYSVTESPASGFDLTGLVCVDPDQGSSVNGATATIDLDNGETVTCTYTNTQRGTIIVAKDTIPNDQTSFEFTSQSLPSSSFNLSDGQSESFSNLVPGPYDVSETANQDYASVGVCSDGSNPSSISVSAGETVTCTFTNTIKQGGITVVKVTNPESSSQSFDFTSDWGNFSLAGGESTNSGPLDPGSYSVSETVPNGWVQTSATCSDDSDPDSISLGPDESVTCTFVNTQLGKIIVEKVTDPSESQESFEFETDYSNNFFLSGGGQNESQPLEPGTYSVSEVMPNGWVQTSATCDDQSDPSAISLSAGETVTCIFTNTQDGKIIVEKQTDPDESQATFEFDPSWDENFMLSDGQQNDSGFLIPGTYSVSEVNLPDRWTRTSAICSDESDPSEISLGPGEIVTCVFTNTYGPQVDLSLSKSVNKESAKTGEQVVFTLTVTNGGPDSATNVVVTDALPAGLSFVSSSASQGSYSNSANEWTVGSLANGVSETLEITATVTATDGTIVNEANVTLDPDTDSNNENDSDSARISVQGDIIPPPPPPPSPSPSPEPPPPSGGGGGGGPFNPGAASGTSTVTPPPAPAPTPTPTPTPTPQVAGAQTLPRTGVDVSSLIWLSLVLLSPLGFRLKPKKKSGKSGK